MLLWKHGGSVLEVGRKRASFSGLELQRRKSQGLSSWLLCCSGLSLFGLRFCSTAELSCFILSPAMAFTNRPTGSVAASSPVTLSLLIPLFLFFTLPLPQLQSCLFWLISGYKNGSSEMFEHSQLFGGTWAWAHQALCFSCGYFAYDQWDMLHYGLYSGLIPSVLAHHLLLLICFTLALYRNVTINYLILTHL